MKNNFKLLSKQDMSSLSISLAEAAHAIEQAIIAVGLGESSNPTKLSLCPTPTLASYAMLGESSRNHTIGMKNSFKYIADANDKINYYTFLSLFDTETGAPLALMDCSLITAIRTSLVSALLARECAKSEAKTALIIGSGTQGRYAIPSLLECNPHLDTIAVCGSYPDSVAEIINQAQLRYPNKNFIQAHDLKTAVENSDIILGVAGPNTNQLAKAEWIKPGTVSILVGYGIEAAALHSADRVVTTSASQMQVTGVDLVNENGCLPRVDAELHEILLQHQPGRLNDNERVFVFNSGLVVTDIALGRIFYNQAQQVNLGSEINLW